MQAVGAMQDEVAVLERLNDEVRLAERLDAHAASKCAALAAGHGLALEHEAEFHRQGGGNVVLGKLEYLLLADEVSASVTDIGNVREPVPENRGDQGRGHGAAGLGCQRGVMNLCASGGEHAAQRFCRVGAGRSLAEDLQRLLDGHAAGDLAAVEPAHAVSQQRHAAFLLANEGVLRLPEIKVVLVDIADRSGGGDAGVA